MDLDIFICTEGSQQMGFGHIYRTITLARELTGRVVFITSSGKPAVDKIVQSGLRSEQWQMMM